MKATPEDRAWVGVSAPASNPSGLAWSLGENGEVFWAADDIDAGVKCLIRELAQAERRGEELTRIIAAGTRTSGTVSHVVTLVVTPDEGERLFGWSRP